MNYGHIESGYNIAIVGENPNEYSDLIRTMLMSSPQINTVFCDNYFEMFENMSFSKFDLIIIDVDNSNGKNFLFKINDKGILSNSLNIPIILIGSDTKEEARINAIDCGFDDYISKPLNISEFSSNIKFLLRKIKKKNNVTNKQILKVGDITMNTLIRTVSICNRGAKISTKEFNILRLFLENPDKVFSRQEILEKIWESSDKLSVRIVDVHINRLRIALGSNRSNRSYIRTVRGYGYSLDIYDTDYRDAKNDSYLDIFSSMQNSNHHLQQMQENFHHQGYTENYSMPINKFLQPN
jgi:DNA-binding response OmpR family regulator